MKSLLGLQKESGEFLSFFFFFFFGYTKHLTPAMEVQSLNHWTSRKALRKWLSEGFWLEFLHLTDFYHIFSQVKECQSSDMVGGA